MRYLTGLVAGSLCLMAGAASANEFSATVTAVSDYDFRGVSLSAKDPALQASIDWAHDSGFYAGAWASNIDYGSDIDGDIELNLYLGFGGEWASGVGWDTGIVWYIYPGSSSSTTASKISAYPEIWFGISKGPFEFKQWFSNDGSGTDENALYTEVNASFDLAENFALNLHAAYNYGDAFDGFEYFDFSVGIGYTAGNFDMELKFTGTDLSGDDEITDDVFNTEPRVLFSISTTFPWAKGE